MVFKCKEQFSLYINCLDKIYGQYSYIGSQGIVYCNPELGTAVKIFHDYLDDCGCFKSKEDILRFSSINAKTFIWPTDVVTVNGEVVGYTMPYITGNSMYKMDPLKVNLLKLISIIKRAEKDIKIVSKNNVALDDVMYNIILNDRVNIIDHDRYFYDSSQDLEKNNIKSFELEFYYFLIEGYFDEFVKDYSELSELYEGKEDLFQFITLFKQKLSENIGHEVRHLTSASKFLNKHKQKTFTYNRDFYR